MAKNKLERFEENKTFTNLFQHTDYDLQKLVFPLKGRWNELYFKNNNPIVLELGCGKGEYTIALAQQFPNMNFIGIDRKGARLWRGAKTAFEAKMANVAFLRTGIDAIVHYFSTCEVSEIWITFPDPQPKKERRRLTSPVFIERYKQILKPNATINLKTDSQELYLYTKETIKTKKWTILEDVDDIYAKITDENSLLVKIQTFYEKMWLEAGKKITYLKFQTLLNG